MGVANLYNVARTQDPNKFKCLKLGVDGDFIQEYIIELGPTTLYCDCFAGLAGKYCRHKKIYNLFLAGDRISKGWKYNIDRDKWYPPESEDDGQG